MAFGQSARIGARNAPLPAGRGAGGEAIFVRYRSRTGRARNASPLQTDSALFRV